MSTTQSFKNRFLIVLYNQHRVAQIAGFEGFQLDGSCPAGEAQSKVRPIHIRLLLNHYLFGAKRIR